MEENPSKDDKNDFLQESNESDYILKNEIFHFH